MNQQQRIYRFDEYVIDSGRRLVLAADNEIEIQPRAFDLLVYLLENRDRAVSKEELQESVWPGRFISETVMSRAVMKARKAVGDDAHSQSVIKTLHGFGYRFVAELKVDEEMPPSVGTEPNIEDRSDLDSSPSGSQSVLSFLRHRSYAALIAVIIAAVFSWWLASDRFDHLYDSYFGIDEVPWVSATGWPEADVLFHRDERWLGGTVGPSVDLGGGRVAWFFGHSYVSELPGRSRTEAGYVSNAIGIQHGYFAPTATMEVFWRTVDSTPASFFSEEGDHWFWPLQAALIDSGLLVFLVEIRSSSGGLGFQPVQVHVVLIENPKETPDKWVFKPLKLTETDADMFIDLAALYSHDEYLYAFSRQMPARDAYLARWMRDEIGSEGAFDTEWWCGDERGWVALDDGLSIARPVISDASHEFRIQFLPALNKYVLVEGWGFPAQVLDIRSADTLTGTWSERQIIYRPEENSRPNIHSHNIGVHPGLQGADIVASYNTNHEISSQAALDTSILYPRFVRIDFDPDK